MIKAKVTIFDDETGRVYEKDREIIPYRQETFIGPNGCAYCVEETEFRFEFNRMR